MAKAFGQTQGKAQSNKVDAYVMKDGDNIVRLVGGVLPRYLYWVPTGRGKDFPIECLAFNRDTEKFDNKEKDHVQEYFPDLKCSWAYVINCIDPTDNKVKVFILKKKLFQQILNAAEDLGDPTDPDTGWNVHFKRSKTGSNAFDVEYTLSVLRCKTAPLTAEERKMVDEAKTIDEVYPRLSSSEVKDLLEGLARGGDDADESDADQASASEAESAKDLG